MKKVESSVSFTKTPRDLLEKQANKRGGVFRQGFIKTPLYPLVGQLGHYTVFPYGGREILIGITDISAGGGPYTGGSTLIRAEIDISKKLKLEIYHKDTPFIKFFKTKKFLMKKIKNENDIFNEKFITKSNNELFMCDFLTNDIMALILKLQDNYPIIEVYKSQFVLTTPKFLYEEDEYDEVIDAYLKIFDRLRRMQIIK